MGVLTQLFEQRSGQLNVNDARGWEAFGGLETDAGVRVSVDGSLKYSAVFACVRILSESIAALPLVLYRRLERGKERARELALYELLHDEPNREMTSFELRELLVSHVALWGDAFCEIEYNRLGEPMGLWPLRPDRMEVERRGGRLRYRYRVPGDNVELSAERIHHIRGLGFNGLRGRSPIKLHMDSVGFGLGVQEFGARYFGNGARPGVILKHPGKLSDTAYNRLKQSFNEAHQGLSNAHRAKILEEGVDLATIGVPPEEAQFLETRRFQVEEIARIYRVPPHMLADLERATFSNIEQQSLNFVMHTLQPWLVRIEQALRRDLIRPEQRGQLFVEHVLDGLLRGDTAARYAAYATGRQNGWFSVNDIRGLENMNPIEGGDVYLEPLNMVPVGQAAAGGGPVADGEEEDERGAATDAEWRVAGKTEGRERRSDEKAGEERQRLMRAHSGLLVDVAARIVRRETNDVRRAVQKYLVKRDDVPGFLLWLSEFYGEHAVFVRKQMRPPLETLALLVLNSVADEIDEEAEDYVERVLEFVGEYAETLGTRWSLSSRQQIEALLREASAETTGSPTDEESDEATAATLIDERLDGWEESQAEKVGRREASQSVNAFAFAAYTAAAVLSLRWVTSGSESCPYCEDLNGKVVSRGSFFLGAGDFQPEGAETPLTVRRGKKHPPIHDGCDCAIVAG